MWSGLEKYKGPRKDGPVGIIPHWRTACEFDWEPLCLDADLLLIKASQSPNQVAEQLQQCSRVLVESLHGAIFADTLGIPWAPIVLSKGFNTFKWNDWLATIDRVFKPFVIDRSLVGSLSLFKAWKNLLSRTLNISYKSFNLSLKPIKKASAEDVRKVIIQLREFSQNHSEFACSTEARVKRQRQSMLQACQITADKYGLQFLKGELLTESQTRT
jgi:succinoglycan biosynthesis protein ExoV